MFLDNHSTLMKTWFLFNIDKLERKRFLNLYVHVTGCIFSVLDKKDQRDCFFNEIKETNSQN